MRKQIFILFFIFQTTWGGCCFSCLKRHGDAVPLNSNASMEVHYNPRISIARYSSDDFERRINTWLSEVKDPDKVGDIVEVKDSCEVKHPCEV